MTTAAENKILTETGPGTPMGDFMRQFWIPAAKSSELTADGDPVRFKILGEELLAFRDTSGRIGVMDHRFLFAKKDIASFAATLRVGHPLGSQF